MEYAALSSAGLIVSCLYSKHNPSSIEGQYLGM